MGKVPDDFRILAYSLTKPHVHKPLQIQEQQYEKAEEQVNIKFHGLYEVK